MKEKSISVLKLVFMGLIIGILLILNACIGGKLNERERVFNGAVKDISKAAGGSITVNDIFIGIPYEHRIYSINENGTEEIIRSETNTLFFQPKKMNYRANFETQMRKLGIYEASVFTANLYIDGNFVFAFPEDSKEFTYKFDEAYVLLNLNDKSLIAQPEFVINDKVYETSFFNAKGNKGLSSIFNCNSGEINFSTMLRVRGAEDFSIKLSSTESHLFVESDWRCPGFSRFDYLPVEYEINDNGFSAEWNVPFDAGDSSHTIGFSYVQPVNLYKMLDRAVNYGFLFIVVPFIVLFLFEVFASINLHPLNYLLCGAASVIFFLLLLSVSEHISFAISYIVSACASGLLVSFYVASVTKRFRLGFTMTLVFAVMYGFLFLSLKSEDYALLIGSLFTFIVLAVVMFLTRKVDWNNIKKTKQLPEEKNAYAD